MEASERLRPLFLFSPGALWNAELVLHSKGHTVTLLEHHVIRAFPKHHGIQHTA